MLHLPQIFLHGSIGKSNRREVRPERFLPQVKRRAMRKKRKAEKKYLGLLEKRKIVNKIYFLRFLKHCQEKVEPLNL